MSLSKLAKVVLFTLCGLAVTYFFAEAQTGNTGGSSGGTGGGQSGVGSGPAANVPSAGGGTFSPMDPDVNPYKDKDGKDYGSFFTTTTTITNNNNGTSENSSSGSNKGSKKKKSSSSSSSSNSPAPSASPTR